MIMKLKKCLKTLKKIFESVHNFEFTQNIIYCAGWYFYHPVFTHHDYQIHPYTSYKPKFLFKAYF